MTRGDIGNFTIGNREKEVKIEGIGLPWLVQLKKEI